MGLNRFPLDEMILDDPFQDRRGAATIPDTVRHHGCDRSPFADITALHFEA